MTPRRADNAGAALAGLLFDLAVRPHLEEHRSVGTRAAQVCSDNSLLGAGQVRELREPELRR